MHLIADFQATTALAVLPIGHTPRYNEGFEAHTTLQLPDLSIFAEVSIALLGFSGLASALGSVSQKNRTFIKFRLRALLIVSGSACFGSLAPLTGLPLYYCAIAFSLLTAGIVFVLVRSLVSTPDISPSRLLSVLCIGWALAGVGLQGYSLTFKPEWLSVAYMFALSGTITVATLFFIRFVLALVQEVD